MSQRSWTDAITNEVLNLLKLLTEDQIGWADRVTVLRGATRHDLIIVASERNTSRRGERRVR